jgi:outer membrane protein assembly factor BamB
MAMNEFRFSHKTVRLLRNITLLCSIFALILSMMLIVNYLQVRHADPLNSKTMTVLTDRLKNNPNDEQLKNEIREIDLIARKAFFTNQWQVKAGGLLLFLNIVVIILCLQAIEYVRKKVPLLPGEKPDPYWEKMKVNRKWVAGTGIVLILVALSLAFLSHQELNKNPDNDSVSQDMTAVVLQNNAGNAGKKVRAGTEISSDVRSRIDSSSQPGYPSGTDTSSSLPAQQEQLNNWPGFRGPGGIGVAGQEDIPTEWDGISGKNIRWKTGISLPGYNSPVIWKDKIFVTGATDSKREVYCLDLKTGKFLWTADASRIQGTPSQVPKVNKETGFSAPTAATNGQQVFAIFANGDIIALSMDGKKIWEKNLGLPNNHYGYSSSLIIYKDKVIVQYDQSGNASVMALSASTGDIAWKTSRNVKISWASPVLVNTGSRMELLLAADPFVISYNPDNGSELWKIESLSGEVGPSLGYANGIVFSVNEYAKLAAIKAGNTPEILWEDNEYLSDVPSPVAIDNYLFLVTSYGVVVCYDAQKGTRYWTKEFGNTIYASPVYAEGRIYLMNSKGTLYIFKADKTFAMVGQPQIGEGSFCTPAFFEGGIVIRGDKNLYSIGN